MLKLFSPCLHPVRVWNKNTNEFMYTSCNKCEACMNVQASKQSMRVKNEILQHRYAVMFTLTYDNEHLPTFEVISDSKGVMQLRPSKDVEYKFDSCPLNYERVDGTMQFDDDLLLPTIENAEPSLKFGVVCKYDIQTFMKRLRFKIDKLNISKNEKRIRYYISSEYGPQTFRPHYHGILFFDNEVILDKIGSFIVESWGKFERQKGRINSFKFVSFARPILTLEAVKVCDANTAYYVAEYVAGNLGLPRVLRTRGTKPFHLQSKAPVIGSYKDTRTEVLGYINAGTYTTDEYRYNKTLDSVELVTIPLCQDVCSSMFRKCVGYSVMDVSTKYLLYSFVQRHFSDWQTYVEETALIKGYVTYYTSFDKLGKLVGKILRECCCTFRQYCKRHFKQEYEQLDLDTDQNWYCSLNAFRVTNRLDFRQFYPYVDKIQAYVNMFDKYLYLKEQYKFKTFFERFNQLVDDVGYHSTILAAYPFMVENLPRLKREAIMPAQRELYKENPYERVFFNTMDIFGKYYSLGVMSVQKLKKVDITNTEYYKQFKAQQIDRLNKRNKSKKINNTNICGVRKIG